MELRAQLRRLLTNKRRLLATLGALVGFGVFFPLLLVPSAMAFGERLAGGSAPLGTAGVGLWAATGVVAYLGAANGFNQAQVGTTGPLVRTSIPPRAVSIGRFLARSAQSLAIVVPVSVALLGGVAIGGGPAAAAFVAIAAVPVLAAGLIVGGIVGNLFRYANERLQLSLWLKALLLLVIMTGAFLGTQLVLDARFEGEGGFATGTLIPGTPLQSYVAVVFAPFGTTLEPLGIAAIAFLLVAIPVAFLGEIRLETYLLVSDVGTDASTAGRTDESYGVPQLFDVTPSTRISWRYLVRTRRDPRMLAHLMPILFGAFGMAGSAIQDPGILLSIGPGATVVAGAILAGSAYCLNPLGDDRDQLPLLFTSTDSIDVVLRGRMLAGIALGLIVAVGIGAPLAAVEHGPRYVLGQSLLAVVLAGASVGIAVGFGAVAPKFERREYMSVERAHPSQWALFGFSFGALIVSVIGFLLLGVTLSGEYLLPAVFGWLLYVVVLAVASWGGYRYAVGRFDGFTMDDI